MSEERPSIIITSNPLNHEGGVVGFCRMLLERCDRSQVLLSHHPLGSRMEQFHAPLLKPLIYPFQYVRDVVRLVGRFRDDPRPTAVQVNPSLIPLPLLRDGIVLSMAHRHGLRSIVVFHGWKQRTLKLIERNALLRHWIRRVYSRAAVTVVLSSTFRDDLVRLGWFPDKIHVTTTAYDSKEIVESRDRTGRALRFLFLGRVSPLKGMDELMVASSVLKEQGYRFELNVVGHGHKQHTLEEYRERADRLGLQSCVSFAGRLTGADKYNAYADADIFVLPSYTEGCPTAVLEALGTGMFVIATRVGALPDIIHKRTGRLISPRDSETLATTMAWACDHANELRAGSLDRKKEAQERYEVMNVVGTFARLYSELAESRI